MLCPTNFTTIDWGFTMEQIIRLCGHPESQSSYNETFSLSQGVANGQAIGNYSQISHQTLTQENASSQQLNDTIQKTIVFTKFIYSNPQPTILIFRDGILIERHILDANGKN
jgi:hypothetical protein